VTMRFLIALAFAAPLYAQTCTWVVTPTSFSISAATYTSTVHVTQTQGSACGTYSATVPVQTSWLHINSGPTGTPGTDVTFSADQNLAATPRSGVMTIATQTVTVTQAGASCAFAITPTTQSFPVAGGNGTFNVQAACSWQAASNASWITVNTAGSSSPVGYSVAANTCVDVRRGTISLVTNLPAPPAFTVTQDGSPANMSLSPASAAVAAAGINDYVTVTTGDVCNWTATPDVSWIQISSGATGTGSFKIFYHVLANTAAQRTGSIHVGALTFTITQQAPGPPAPTLTTVANAASYTADAISPGEIVVLFGANMGPASIASLQVSNGTVTNLLAGTQVMFDGVAAAMIYTLGGQVSAVVPYGVAGKTNTQVQVQYQGSASNTLTVPVQAATPGIFSLDSSGIGPGAILNQDTSINSTGNPAATGSVIALYCTGGGVTAPASGDGEVIGGALRNLVQTAVTSVTIGGMNAPVQFAGAVPGAVAGLTQINVQIPTGLTPSNALPVVVKIGNFTSTSLVTVAVK
jgi:uncharacterized protein (TIGR03437 family)